ncbi:MAG TPA: UDP-N-acetylmuramoyl-L-alanine--D-glutamate ligase, partial [Acidobacteriota bacterium]|nr:UDP-N-acetylmuramoyl-L-alanine--D-glutamate ligase [Acidobacteriota bacterium]
MNYREKSILIAGAGRSGLASARFLLARGARVTLTDIMRREELEPGISGLIEAASSYPGQLTLELGRHRDEDFLNADLVVLSPGIPLSLRFPDLSRNAGIPVIAEIELAHRHLKGTIIGITGSNGKTTTTALTAELLAGAGLRAHAAGNIGIPLVDFADGSTEEDFHVVELSSFQLESISDFRPFIGSILNISPDHMDRYAGLDEYIAAKLRLFMNQKETDFSVLNADDKRISAMRKETRARIVEFSRLEPVGIGACVRNGHVVFRDGYSETVLFPVNAVNLKGSHNLENVLASCAIAMLAGAAAASLGDSVRRFKGIEHRLEFVAELDGVRYFNDSKATNVAAALKSIDSFSGNIILIAGGRDKAGDFDALRPLVRRRVKHLVALGEAAGKIKKSLGDSTGTSDAHSMEEAVLIARRLAGP